MKLAATSSQHFTSYHLYWVKKTWINEDADDANIVFGAVNIDKGFYAESPTGWWITIVGVSEMNSDGTRKGVKNNHSSSEPKKLNEEERQDDSVELMAWIEAPEIGCFSTSQLQTKSVGFHANKTANGDTETGGNVMKLRFRNVAVIAGPVLWMIIPLAAIHAADCPADQHDGVRVQGCQVGDNIQVLVHNYNNYGVRIDVTLTYQLKSGAQKTEAYSYQHVGPNDGGQVALIQVRPYGSLNDVTDVSLKSVNQSN